MRSTTAIIPQHHMHIIIQVTNHYIIVYIAISYNNHASHYKCPIHHNKHINNINKNINKYMRYITKSVKSVRPRWQDGLAGGGSTVWRSLSIARWPIAGRGVVYSLTGEYQDAVPGGGQYWQWCGWLHHSSDPWTPQQGKQIRPPLHGRPQLEQPSSLFPYSQCMPQCARCSYQGQLYTVTSRADPPSKRLTTSL